LTIGQATEPDAVRWLVVDEHGEHVDKSSNLGSSGAPKPPLDPVQVIDTNRSGAVSGCDIAADGQAWRLSRRWLRPPSAGQVPPTSSTPAPGSHQERKYSALLLTTALSLEPVTSTLRALLAWLSGISFGSWLLAALGGRWFSARALAPVSRMASAARSMETADMGKHLPVAPTGDELEDLGRTLNALLDRRHEAFERQRRFTGDASHQLRTPLTAMLGQVEVALRRERSADEYRQVLNLVKHQSIHLRQIIEMLLFLARADAEAKLTQLETIDLRDWLAQYLQRWRSHERAADIQLRTSTEDSLEVQAQGPLLGQLVDNLLENAAKYSPAGTPITLQMAADTEGVLLTVEDRGCGIPADDLPHIFEPFFRSSQVRQQGQGGVGLGLAVAHRIAVAFGGNLTAESREGKGTSLTLRLKRAYPAMAPISAL
jgi:signal transduction histidine kinase